MRIWQIVDGKPGHENQTGGLISALARALGPPGPTVDRIPVADASNGFVDWLRGRFPAGNALPGPDIVVGAGHRTHGHVLAARRRHGGRSVILMKPSVPTRLFDLCIIPEHDGVPASAHVLTTRGVLNRMQPGGRHDPTRAVILIGGPSSHTQWNDDQVIEQIAAIVGARPRTSYVLTTSRRTPGGFLQRLRARALSRVEVFPVDETGPDWLAGQLSMAAEAWVTADSVSMVYESLSAGVAVGIIGLPLRRGSRVVRGLQQLIADRRVTHYDDWLTQPRPLALPSEPFNEADRCAHWMLDHWPELRN